MFRGKVLVPSSATCVFPVSSLAHSSMLKRGAVHSSETPEDVHWTTQHYIQKTALSLFKDYCFLFIASGVAQSPLYCGHFWPIVSAPDDRWGWLWSNWWNEDWQGKPKYSEKTCPSATLSTTNSTWPDPGSNPGRRGGKPATIRLSYGVALLFKDYLMMPPTLQITQCQMLEWIAEDVEESGSGLILSNYV
jgi:hypothetical protein